MPERRFCHSSNPAFTCHPAVLLLPFGRRSYLPAIVDATAAEQLELDDTTDRVAYDLRGAPGPTTVLYSGMGGPAAANALEMIAANGGRRVVLFGACGGVTPEVAIGDLVVASGAVRGEGTSRYYAPPGYPAMCDLRLSVRLADQAVSTGQVTVHRGVTWPVLTA